MKKLSFTLLLGGSMLFNSNQSYAESDHYFVGQIKDPLNLNPNIKYLGKPIYELMCILYWPSAHLLTEVSRVTVPRAPLNQNFSDIISATSENNFFLSGPSEKYSLNYQFLSYENLSEVNKKIFDHFNFDKNKYMTILGFDGTYNAQSKKKEPKPGYFIQDDKVQFLTWIFLTDCKYGLTDFPNVEYDIYNNIVYFGPRIRAENEYVYGEEQIDMHTLELSQDPYQKHLAVAIKDLFQTFYIGYISSNSSLLLTKIPKNQNFKGHITGKIVHQGTYSKTISYQIFSYDRLSNDNKKIFDHFNFDRNKCVSILGFDGTYDRNAKNKKQQPKPGYFIQDDKIKKLEWDFSGYEDYYLRDFREITYNIPEPDYS